MSDEKKNLPEATGYIRDLGIARIDSGRRDRTGAPEAVYAEGKSAEQVSAIVREHNLDDGPLLVTRLGQDQITLLENMREEIQIHRQARMATVGRSEKTHRRAAIIAAGTSDLPVAEEAAVTLHTLGHTVARFFDVGVAGLHRLLEPLPEIIQNDVLIVVAGMEGALPSVVGGLTDVPTIAVPTSIGYGASLGGIAALLGMLNSCAPGLSVVNIDNGFGAALAAHRILRRIPSQE